MAFELVELLKQSGDYLRRESLEQIDLDLIDEDERNFYSLDSRSLDELAANIELCGLMDPIRVRPKDGRYIVVSGHRRRRACLKLRDEGNDSFKTVPCIVETAGSEAMQELRLIYANRNTRVLTSADINRQTERVTELLYKLKEEGMEFPGRMSDHVAQACQISTTKLKRLHAIRNNLISEFYSCYDSGMLNETAAYALSRLPTDVQEHLATKKKILNQAMTKDCLSGLRVDDAIKYAERYCTAPRCCKDSTAMCTHSLDRYAATICNSSWSPCRGECCCECSNLENCAYPCKHGKAQLATINTQRKADADAAREAEQSAKDTQQIYRRLRHMDQIMRLAELADRAGLPDDVDLGTKSWLHVTAGGLRQLANDGMGKDTYLYCDDYSPLDCGLCDLQKLAEKLKCTVGELAGEEPAAVSTADTNPWHRGELPKESGYYLGKWRKNTEVYYFNAEKQAWTDFADSEYSLEDVDAWMEIPKDDDE